MSLSTLDLYLKWGPLVMWAPHISRLYLFFEIGPLISEFHISIRLLSGDK